MLRKTTTAMVLSATLLAGAVVGCGGQGASTTETTEATEVTEAGGTTEAGAVDDGVLDELKEAIANMPAFTSVTVTVHSVSTFTPLDGGDPETIEGTTVYKFDDGGTPKSSTRSESLDIAMEFYTDGDNAVLVSDGKAYGGTTEQFGMVQSQGSEATLTNTTGDLDTLVMVASGVEREQVGDDTVYNLTLDVDRYIESDEILSTMAQNGGRVQDATVSITFDADGHIVGVNQATDYESFSTTTEVTLTDFDSTVVDAMPEPTATYEELEADSLAAGATATPEADAAAE